MKGTQRKKIKIAILSAILNEYVVFSRAKENPSQNFSQHSKILVPIGFQD